MRFSSFVSATASALMLTGCSDLLSLNSFVPDKESVADPSLAGTWKGSDEEALYIVLQTNSAYSITYTDKKDTAKFQGHLMNAGEAEILDLVVERESAFQIPVHMIVRVWPKGSTLRWVFLDSKWLRELAVQQLASQPSGDRTLISAPGEAVRDLVQKYGADTKAYDNKPNVLVRQ